MFALSQKWRWIGVLTMLLTGCASAPPSVVMVTNPFHGSNSTYRPTNHEELIGMVKYLVSANASEMETRREQAFQRMFHACDGPYKIINEDSRFGGSLTRYENYSATSSNLDYIYVQFECENKKPHAQQRKDASNFSTLSGNEIRNTPSNQSIEKKDLSVLMGPGLGTGLRLNELNDDYLGGLFRVAFDTGDWRIDLDVMGYQGSGLNDLVSGIIGGSFILLPDAKISPFLGADFGLGWGYTTGSGKGGQFGLHAGVEFFRRYQVRLVPEIQVIFPLYLEKYTTSVDYYGVEVGSYYEPSVLFNLILLFEL